MSSLVMAGTEAVIACEYLIFSLGGEALAIDILKVQEIRGYETPTVIADAPPFVKGVINLRGVIVPIIDLRIRFNAASAEYTAFTVVIILAIGGRLVGIVVDGVSDVTQLNAGEIRPPPAFSPRQVRHRVYRWSCDVWRTHVDGS